MMDEAIEAAKSAEVVIMVLGGSEVTVREERSRTSLDLPGRQEELLKAVCKLGKPTILVMIDGRASSINYAKNMYLPFSMHGFRESSADRQLQKQSLEIIILGVD